MLEFFFHKRRGTALGFKQEGPHEPSCFDPQSTSGRLIFSARMTDDGIFFMIGADQSVIDEGSLMEFAIDSSSKVP
jgi:hypothetical protein